MLSSFNFLLLLPFFIDCEENEKWKSLSRIIIVTLGLRCYSYHFNQNYGYLKETDVSSKSSDPSWHYLHSHVSLKQSGPNFINLASDTVQVRGPWIWEFDKVLIWPVSYSGLQRLGNEMRTLHCSRIRMQFGNQSKFQARRLASSSHGKAKQYFCHRSQKSYRVSRNYFKRGNRESGRGRAFRTLGHFWEIN